MRAIDIMLTGYQSSSETIVYVDDMPVEFQKNQFNNLTCRYQTESNKVNIKIIKMLDVGGFVWFITQLFFFLISIFGLFDTHKKRKCTIIDYDADIYLQNVNFITLRLNPVMQYGRPVTIETQLAVQEKSNAFVVDMKAKKTLKGLLIAKILLALAIVITLVVVIVLNFFGG